MCFSWWAEHKGNRLQHNNHCTHEITPSFKGGAYSWTGFTFQIAILILSEPEQTIHDLPWSYVLLWSLTSISTSQLVTDLSWCTYCGQPESHAPKHLTLWIKHLSQGHFSSYLLYSILEHIPRRWSVHILSPESWGQHTFWVCHSHHKPRTEP